MDKSIREYGGLQGPRSIGEIWRTTRTKVHWGNMEGLQGPRSIGEYGGTTRTKVHWGNMEDYKDQGPLY